MPSLETPGGKAVPLDTEAVNKAFDQTMNDDPPDQDAPPKRTQDPPAQDKPKRTRRPRQPRESKSEKSRTTSSASRALTDEQRTEGVKGITQIAGAMCLMAAKATASPAWEADAVVIADNADEIADAVVATAQADARFAVALDKVCSAGPYAALVTVMVTVGGQIARNHRPTLALPGTVDPVELLTRPDANQ